MQHLRTLRRTLKTTLSQGFRQGVNSTRVKVPKFQTKPPACPMPGFYLTDRNHQTQGHPNGPKRRRQHGSHLPLTPSRHILRQCHLTVATEEAEEAGVEAEVEAEVGVEAEMEDPEVHHAETNRPTRMTRNHPPTVNPTPKVLETTTNRLPHPKDLRAHLVRGLLAGPEVKQNREKHPPVLTGNNSRPHTACLESPAYLLPAP
jgi:hypothetical protein